MKSEPSEGLEIAPRAVTRTDREELLERFASLHPLQLVY